MDATEIEGEWNGESVRTPLSLSLTLGGVTPLPPLSPHMSTRSSCLLPPDEQVLPSHSLLHLSYASFEEGEGNVDEAR